MSERKTFLYRLGVFGFTTLVFVSYSIVFARHIWNGLDSDVWDELVWLTTLCATVFHAQAVHASYQAYLRSQGGSLPLLTIGPFTILPGIIGHAATPVLPSASGRRRMSNDEAFDRLMAATPDLEEDFIVHRHDTSVIIVSPPTPSSPCSIHASPNLQTPDSDYFSNPQIQRETDGTPTRPGAFRTVSGQWFARRQGCEDDLERGKAMVGLGLGSLNYTGIRA